MNRILYLLLFVSMFSSCAEEAAPIEIQPRPVKYIEVGYAGGELIRTFNGTCRTDKIINLSFRSAGIITSWGVKLGQKVQEGQRLASLDNVQSRLNYESSIASLNSAESQMNTAKLALDRTRSLYEKGSAALSDFEGAKNSYKTAQQTFESAKRSVAIQKDQVSYGYLNAPENGVIASVISEIDENVAAGQTVAVLNAGTDMEVSLGLPESIINGVKVGMQVEVGFSSLGTTTYLGRVSEVAPALDNNTATYPILVTMIDPGSEIKSGMAAKVTFDFGDHDPLKQQTLIVPAHAVGENSDGRFVFTIKDEGGKHRVERVFVEVGPLSTEGFAIKSGLKAGDRIATAGLQTLLNGQEVRLN